MNMFTPINFRLSNIISRPLTKTTLYKLKMEDGTTKFAPNYYNFLITSEKLSFPETVVAESNNDGILIANEKNKINLYQVKSNWTIKKIRSVTFKTYKVLVFRFVGDVVYIGCKPKNEYDEGFRKSDKYGVKANIFYKWEYKTEKEPEIISLPEKIFKYHCNKGIDEILIDGNTLIAVDNIVEPKYCLKYDITKPQHPKLIKIESLETHGSYEHVRYGFLKGGFISLLSHSFHSGGGCAYIAIMDKTTMKDIAIVSDSVYERKWKLRKKWRNDPV